MIFVILQAVGAVGTMALLDSRRIGTRRARGLLSIAVMGLFTLGLWIGLCVWLSQHPIDLTNPPLWDWTDGPFGGFIVLTLLFGINMVAVSVLWTPRCVLQFASTAYFPTKKRQDQIEQQT